jgi:hypothetical protein
MIKKQVSASLVSVEVTRSTRKQKFLPQINALLDWSVLETALYKVFKRSKDAARAPLRMPQAGLPIIPCYYSR